LLDIERKSSQDDTKEIEKRKKRLLRPKRDDDEESDVDESEGSSIDEDANPQEQQQTKVRPQSSPTPSTTSQLPTQQQNMNTTSRLLQSIPSNNIRTSTSKIMSRNINGGGGNGSDWDEEYRWNELDSPMESCLLIRLNTRLAPDNGGLNVNGSSRDNVDNRGLGGGPSMSGEDTTKSEGEYNNNNLETDEEVGALSSGIRGLWRKGRQQLEEVASQRRASMAATAGSNGREERAAAVAQFIMRKGSGEQQSAQGGTSVAAGGGGEGSGLNQQDLVEYQQRWNEVKEQGSSEGYEYNAPVSTTTVQPRNSATNNTSEGLCLGTLTIPLSRLPLEDAFKEDGKAAVIEKWYQLDDPNNHKRDSMLSEDDDDDPMGGGGLDDEEPTLLHGPRRCPSVLLEITFASSDYLDENEDDVAELDVDVSTLNLASQQQQQQQESPATPVPQQPKQDTKSKNTEPPKKEEPELESGIIDFICIVGARDIGNQRNDDGSKGWVQSTPECCVLERYPPTDEFHINNGRMTGLIPQIEWFCFPEGCKLWRGGDAPNYAEMKAGGVSMMSPSAAAQEASSIGSRGGVISGGMISTGNGNDYTPTKFDKELGTLSSFSWFVLSSNSDEYGSRLVKTYGTMVRFYVPAPVGIDPTQDDFAQTLGGGAGAPSSKAKGNDGKKKRLWVPIGICITTTLPIVGVVEEILLRTCKAMAAKFSADDESATEILTNTSSQQSDSLSSSATSKLYSMLQTDLYHLIVNFSKPMEGVVHCSIPFLEGERLHINASPPNGLPPLPHGGAVAATCRLLGAEGLTLLLAAALTECRILIHSTNVAQVAMVAEVITALIFPFTWQLPYIPVLAQQMLEILDAPLPFFVGVPTASLKNVEKGTLSEIVVVDLDDVASFAEYDSRRGPRNKVPPALPASVSTSISKAVYHLLKEEDELEIETEKIFLPGTRRSPRLESESLPERMFRIHVALQICSLIRGYQECLFFVSALQPVFNRDRFLRQAPALFEDKRPSVLIDSNISDRSQKILSPRAKRFLSVLVNSQHFHQLLERLSSEETAFFHEVMEAIEGGNDDDTGKNKFSATFGSTSFETASNNLFESLERIEHKIPTYVINRPDRKRRSPGALWSFEDEDEDGNFKVKPCEWDRTEPFWLLPEPKKAPPVTFTNNILQPIMADKTNDPSSSSGDAGVHALSLEYLVELEKNPWRYGNLLELPMTEGEGEDAQEDASTTVQLQPRVKLREALSEEHFRAWKIANDHKDDDDMNVTTPIEEQTDNDGFDLSSLLLNVPELPLGGKAETAQPRADAKDRDKVRQCLELAFGSTGQESISSELIVEAELALRNPSAQRYLFSVLVSSVQRKKRSQEDSKAKEAKSRVTTQQTVSRLEPAAFECLVRLCYAVLEACTEEQNYESAYRLLTFTGGFCCFANSPTSTPSEQKTVYMTERISIHSIFADLRLWERVLLLHQQDQQNSKEEEEAAKEEANDEENKDDEGSEDVNTDNEDTTDSDAYDAVVTTLYEMVGYNVPAEEVSRFATRISDEKGWFATEKGQALLVLARRLTAKRDDGDTEKGREAEFASAPTSFVRKDSVPSKDYGVGGVIEADTTLEAEEIAWSHPATCLVSYEKQTTRAYLSNMLGGAATDTIGSSSSHGMYKSPASSPKGNLILDANEGEYAGRVAITAMASFGSSAVVSGGIDGSIFLAHTINFGGDKRRSVNGMQLQWGAKGEVDRDSGPGSATCVAASKGSGYRLGGQATDKVNSKPASDGNSSPDEEEILSSMEGCHVIAGATGGSLRVWSLKDVYQASAMNRRENAASNASSPTHLNRSQHGVSGATSIRVSSDDFGLNEAISGVSIGGHRGGVACIDLPPRMYRPDSLVSGGEDGLIKLWSIKPKASDQDGGAQANSIQSRFFNTRQITSMTTDFDATDAQGVLTGHEGKILCIKTAWHGDKLLSGGADKTVRLWDLSGSSGKPLSTLRGHWGWVTATHFWGANTIVSASTDRSIHLWDTRVGSSPLFALRYHLSPVSDLLLGNRSEPLMVSAGADGSLATWDFRVLSGARAESTTDGKEESNKAQASRTIRSPIARMNHVNQLNLSRNNCGSVKLARAIGRDDFSFFSASDDGVVNEWEAACGAKMSTFDSGHRDAISSFVSFSSSDCLQQNKSTGGRGSAVGGTITCSWDGTVRLRRLSRKSVA